MLAREGRLPVAADCWQCYHPPLFYLLGWPLYAAVGLPWLAVSAAVATYYGYRLLRRFGCRGASLAGGTALLLTFPCLVMGTAFTRRFVWAAAVTSALISLVTFRPAGVEQPAAGSLQRDAVASVDAGGDGRL